MSIETQKTVSTVIVKDDRDISLLFTAMCYAKELMRDKKDKTQREKDVIAFCSNIIEAINGEKSSEDA